MSKFHLLLATSVLALTITTAQIAHAQATQADSTFNFSRECQGSLLNSIISNTRALHDYLKKEGDLSPAYTDGLIAGFDTETSAALTKWQQANGVPTTGTLDPKTHSAINAKSIADGGKAILADELACKTPTSTSTSTTQSTTTTLISLTTNSAPTTATPPTPAGHAQKPVFLFTKNLNFGMRSADVKALQEKLKSLGYLLKSFIPTTTFGKVTREAVQKFQRAHGVTANGSVGPKTRALLNIN
jgi:peptidoglycan hydrolase-like protein with peptidoglycan-binding domain